MRLQNAKKEGWTRVKAKVGSQKHEDDARRLAVCREVLGDGKSETRNQSKLIVNQMAF